LSLTEKLDILLPIEPEKQFVAISYGSSLLRFTGLPWFDYLPI